MSDWRPINTAPKGESLLLFCRTVLIYVGRFRYGVLREPQQDVLAWRCDSSGNFTDPTHWMPLLAPPERSYP